MILDKVISWWRRLWRRQAYKRLLLVESMTEVPERVGADIYVVRRGGLDRRVVLSCPCRCGRRIDLNLATNQAPHWSVAVHQGRVSIDPSIWLRKDQCQSHFFVRGNRVLWV